MKSKNHEKSIRIKTRIESDTIQIPELSRWIGRDVEILVVEEEIRGNRKFSRLRAAAGRDYVDADSVMRLREASLL
ncbi:MAG TPA: hypothetical protein PKW18_00580 [Candidatus Sumerlaeota bacterium]|nr:MAG: hypothetical protein BWY12_00030 [candidate division BRC1 bacterium ADurb.Bin183]HOE62595.1 hypothetical protein [Candidatus Sumerlaeota bacterium]HRR30935.1 hypothetical protein [Candidatus Sumerlaeia bacterium]HON49355.1 hypothetical protein [Candidatus Sumerlaeota bacterium]HOR64897.1 hypothetical protein [Candidatus Sumerlaeota bacterium]